ncbi:hypothetical protein CPAR01_00451 [Colletotrichum paranaense]|uniref:Heterokaryon incompatibility domain-containing protein n=1 Tax=Colletotrichum paranaense TaxID=1914294 RepID=A0ABQ9T3Y7_9PEZI|nr:uncharacterized protein CPAR01_00451 [Colletotrichum paranaense]KAK1546484.1 hypothetical protein CPAR01_00451 [Colletotrichum paranaense]
MGYSHYYDVKDWNSPQWRKVWPRFIEDSLLIMEASDVRLIETEPCLDYDLEATSPPVCTVERGINFNGLGEAGHEPFFLCEQEPGLVNTNRKPYDLTISCILLRAFALCPKNIKISSNGSWNEYTWENALLSYVWGSVDQVKLTSANIRELSRPQGLESVWSQIPTTVRDAMMVYSARDRKIQILRMRSIYSAATFTIVAVSAKDAHEGLLTKRAGAVLPGCRSVEDFEALLAASAWSRRGWCYQEQVLSHRAILFTANGIFFQCQEALYDLEGVQLPKPEFPSTSLSPSQRVGGLLNIPYGESLEYFLSAVELYSKRNFTYANDKISAFQGVFHRHEGLMDGKSSMFHFGLPTCAFDQTFCWETPKHNPHLRNPNFPSWSWLGWDDGVIFDRSLIRTTRTSQILGADLPPGFFTPRNTHPSYKLRKPMIEPRAHNETFGFPTSVNRGLIIGHTLPDIPVCTSSAHLLISACAERTRHSNSLYAVFPTLCRQSTVVQVSELVCIQTQPPSASDSTLNQESRQYDIHDHDDHGDCVAKTPLGYIWLDSNWRECQAEVQVMKFIALSGYEGLSVNDFKL